MSVLTPSARTRLAAELDQLIHRALPSAEAMVRESRDAGDMAENNDYFLAKAEEDAVRLRMAEIIRLLAVPAAPAPAGEIVEPGVTVTARFADGTDERFLVGSIEERPGDATVLTPQSPLGQALLGAKVGDSVSASIPAGKLTVQVVEITVQG
jgi:transcription elongation factor GreA